MIIDPCIVSIEKRAEAAKIPMAELHRRAGTNPSTWLRAKSGTVSPRLKTIRKYEAALEEVIAERRTQLDTLPEAVTL